MKNTDQSPEPTKESEPTFLQPTPEQVKKMNEQIAEALKAANENAKAGIWPNSRVKK